MDDKWASILRLDEKILWATRSSGPAHRAGAPEVRAVISHIIFKTTHHLFPVWMTPKFPNYFPLPGSPTNHPSQQSQKVLQVPGPWRIHRGDKCHTLRATWQTAWCPFPGSACSVSSCWACLLYTPLQQSQLELMGSLPHPVDSPQSIALFQRASSRNNWPAMSFGSEKLSLSVSGHSTNSYNTD